MAVDDTALTVLELDPATGALRRTIDLRPPFPQRRSLIATWSLAFADQAAWATLPNNGAPRTR
jgi:hypothetical protein